MIRINSIKEFVRIDKLKEKIHFKNVKNGNFEELNTPYIQYDDATIQYDQADKFYTNFISSEKPKISKL